MKLVLWKKRQLKLFPPQPKAAKVSKAVISNMTESRSAGPMRVVVNNTLAAAAATRKPPLLVVSATNTGSMDKALATLPMANRTALPSTTLLASPSNVTRPTANTLASHSSAHVDPTRHRAPTLALVILGSFLITALALAAVIFLRRNWIARRVREQELRKYVEYRPRVMEQVENIGNDTKPEVQQAVSVVGELKAWNGFQKTAAPFSTRKSMTSNSIVNDPFRPSSNMPSIFLSGQRDSISADDSISVVAASTQQRRIVYKD